MKKRNYILASHGTMAKGIYDAMEIIVGEPENVTCYGAYIDGEDTDVEKDVEELLATYSEDEEIIVLTDLYGGSVNTKFVHHLGRKNYHLITGMNLAMVLFLLESDEENTEELLKTAVIQAGKSVRYCNQSIQKLAEEDDF